MKTIEQYQCEYCKTRYNIKDECVRCESSHVEPSSITNGRYISFFKYPKYIDVTMNNGVIVRYECIGDLGGVN